MAFSLISCENTLTPSEYTPSESSPSLEDPSPGQWRLSGEVYAPPDWNPVETTALFRIWLCCWLYPLEDRFWVYLSPNCYEWTLHYINPTTSYWTFDINWFGTGYQWFTPGETMWSLPDHDPPIIKTTYVKGYVHEGQVLFVLKDTDYSRQPYNPEEWSPGGWWYELWYPLKWWWHTVSLDLR